MKIKVKLAGHLKKYGYKGASEFQIELTQGSTVQDIISQLEIPDSSFAFCSVNGIKESSKHPLNDGDAVAIYPPLSGG